MFWNTNRASHAIRFHLVGDEHILPEDVVPDDLCADNSADDFTSVDSDAHVQVLQGRVLRLISFLCDNVDHFETDLDDTERFIHLDDLCTSFFGNFSCVAHYDVAVTDCVHFVDADLFAKLVKLAEETGKEIYYFLGLCVLREFSEANHVCVEQCDIVEWVDDALIVLDTRKDMQRHKLSKQIFCLFDLDFDDSLLIVLSTNLHLSAVRGQDQKGKQSKLQHTIDHVSLQVKYFFLYEEEVLRYKRKVQDYLYWSEHSEWDSSRKHYDHLIDAKSHLLWRAEQEILEPGSVEDEEHHREADTDNLDYQEDHDTGGSKPFDIVDQGGHEAGNHYEDNYVNVVVVVTEVAEYEHFDDDQINDGLRDELEHFKTVIFL